MRRLPAFILTLALPMIASAVSPFAIDIETKSVRIPGEQRRAAVFETCVMSLSDAPIDVSFDTECPYGTAADPSSFSLRLEPGERVETNVVFRAVSIDAVDAVVSLNVSCDDAAGGRFTRGKQLRLRAEELPATLFDAPVRIPWSLAFGLALFAYAARHRVRHGTATACEAFAVIACTAYLAWMLRVDLIFGGGLDLGGDLPAHHYLVNRILESGRAVSWAPGWWGGFPMFRYYFPLPYCVAAALSPILGHNAAFGLFSVAGLLLLPLSLWGAGKIAHLPRPAPSFLAALAIPLALDNTHNMWGVNAYSTLAGMIANSWSFDLFVLSLALAVRDVRHDRFSIVTVLAWSAMALSHFFTAVIAAIAIASLAAAGALSGRRRGARALLLEGVCAGLVCAWWLAPLVATGAWSVAFGSQWEIGFWKQLPPMLTPVMLGASAIAAIAASGGPRREPPSGGARMWLLAHAALFVGAIALFYGGRCLAEVFVNCRLWPFIVYAMLVFTALAWASLARQLGIEAVAPLAFCALCASLAWRVGGNLENPRWSRGNYVRDWASFNHAGVEALPHGREFFEIAEAVRGLPGRVSWDLHPDNENFGSTRCFEALPYLVGSRTLEGGIVNSALGALPAYTIQGLVSDEPAGWPLLVHPKSFNPDLGIPMLEGYGVRAFIARSPRVRAAFDEAAGWERVRSFGKDGDRALYVCGKPACAAWLCPDIPVIDADTDAQKKIVEWLDHCDYPALETPAGESEFRPDGSIALRVAPECIGKPVLVDAMYYPSWRAKGADGPSLLASGQMMIVPKQTDVELNHVSLPSEIAGRILSAAGLALLAFLALKEKRRIATEEAAENA